VTLDSGASTTAEASPAPDPASEAPDDTQRAIDALTRRLAELPHESETVAREFHPPTVHEIPGFVPPLPEPAPASSANQEPEKYLGEAAIRQMAEQLRPEHRPLWRLGPLPLAFVALAVIGCAVFAASRLTRGHQAPPRSLLSRYQDELAQEDAHQGLAGLPSAAPRPLGGPPDGSAARGAPRTPASPKKRAAGVTPAREDAMPAALRGQGDRGSAPSSADARAIDRDLQEAFGTSRPTIPANASAQDPPMPPWVKGVQLAEAKPAPSGDRKLGGRYGDHLLLQLRSNLDSRLCGSGTVEAVLVRPYVISGAVILPPRTLAFGQCSVQAGRFLVTFVRLRLPDGSEVQFEGVAIDVADRKPGLLATRRIDGDQPPRSRESLGGDIARGAASTLLGAATGSAGLAGQLTNSAGQSAINARPEEPVRAEQALLLDAPAALEVFVRREF